MNQIRSLDGTLIAYKRSGAGPPLLLVHGTTADHQRWELISPHFEEQFTIYAVDRRDRGGSGDSPAYNLLREAEDLVTLTDAIYQEAKIPVDILAHSFGAVCSLEAALLTTNVGRLVLYEPPIPTGLAMYPPDLPERMQALIERGELEHALETFFRETVKMPEAEFATYRQQPVWQVRIALTPTIPREMSFDKSYHFDSQKFNHLMTPTLLLLGSESPQMFRQAVDWIDAALPNSQVKELPGQRHVAMDTAPELFVNEVLDYLTSN